MGLETEKIIRLKVFEAERTQVPWNKERAWLNITPAEVTGRSWLWYAAAGLLLCAGTSAYLMVSRQAAAEIRLARIGERVTCVTGQIKSVATMGVMGSVGCKAVTVSASSVDKNLPRVVTTSARKIELTTTPEIVPAEIVQVQAAAVPEESVQGPTAAVENIKQEKKVIEAVIGVIPAVPEMRIVESKRKKRKFEIELLAPDLREVKSYSETDRRSFTARIN